MVVASEIEVPEIPERLVWKTLNNITRTATGPDSILFWVWKEHAENLTPILSHTAHAHLAYVMEKIEYQSDIQG